MTVKELQELLETTDAQVWAKEWVRIAQEIEAADDERQVIDEGWMIAWFANAIETGRDAGARAYADLFDSDALIIRRDENGEWSPAVVAVVKSAIGASMVDQMGWGESKPFAALEAYALAEGQSVAALDALASSQGVEP